MQRPPKRAPMGGARYAGLTPAVQKERVPVSYGAAAGAKPHPSAPYTFVNHNDHSKASAGVPGNVSDGHLPAVEAPQGSIITFGAAEVPGVSGGGGGGAQSASAPIVGSSSSTGAATAAATRASAMPAFGHQPRAPRSSQAPVQLGVAGVRTGEEVLIEVPGPRKRSSAEDGQTASNAAEVEILKRKLALSREECKALQEKLQKRKQEVNRTQRIASLASEEAEKRLGLVMKGWEAREASCYELARGALRQAGEGSAAQKSAHDAQLRALQDQTERDRVNFEAQLAAQTKAHNESKEAARQSETGEMDALRAQIEALKAELSSVRQKHAIEKQTVEAQLMSVQQELHTTQRTLQEKLVLLASNELLVTQCRQFVLSICQPGFSVVKDESLEPVDKNRGEPSGFVLVPLLVLLHGYALLPESERRDVIDTYEKKSVQL